MIVLKCNYRFAETLWSCVYFLSKDMFSIDSREREKRPSIVSHMSPDPEYVP